MATNPAGEITAGNTQAQDPAAAASAPTAAFCHAAAALTLRADLPEYFIRSLTSGAAASLLPPAAVLAIMKWVRW